jgi:hypothetical protein
MRMSGTFFASVLNLLRYSFAALGRAIVAPERDAVAEEVRGLVTTKDRIMLQLYMKVAEDEGISLREFLLKYRLGVEKRKGID